MRAAPAFPSPWSLGALPLRPPSVADDGLVLLVFPAGGREDPRAAGLVLVVVSRRASRSSMDMVKL